jgi:hypothetical protein
VFACASAYRTAITFCYFETLMRSFCKKKISDETNRMLAMVPMIKKCGYKDEFIKHYMEHAVGFLRELPTWAKRAELMRLFNDGSIKSMNIIMWFKVFILSRLSHEVYY